MRHALVSLALMLSVAGCGGGDATPADGGATIVTHETRFVDDPPVYEAVPLPEGLEWVTNEDDPVFASPDAKRGGTFTTYITGFPLTLRLHGPDSATGSFVSMKRSQFLSLVDLHPNTLNFIPSLATHWAFGPDGKSVYYKLDPRARWSDGTPITADDYVFAREMRISPHLVDPYGQNYFTEVIVDVQKHDDYTISVHGAAAKPMNEMLYEYGISPEPRHFHKLDENWVTDYNWRIEPTTGPYRIDRVVNGRYIEFVRLDDWWANDLKYYQNRFNVDRIRVEIIRDDNVAFEHFLRGELDNYNLGIPAYWHDKAVGTPFDRGYIHKIQFYNDVPRESRGFWLNGDVPLLSDLNVRLGLAHSMNWEAVIATVLRGDYERLNQHFEGYYWGYTNENIKARPYDLAAADRYFTAAGWTQRGPDGIRTKDGQRLSVDISYASPELSPQLVLLKEEARKAGVELNLRLLDPSTWGNQVGEKNYQMVFLRFGTGLTPSYWQHYHSDNAHKPQTNNLTATDDPELDRLIDEYDAAADIDTRLRLSHQIQQIVHDKAGFIPAYKMPYLREAYWRWIKTPEGYGVRTSTEIADPFSSGLFWIDEDVKRETLEARAAGRAFEPVTIVDETWRTD